jgi:endoribonuclease Dicer
MGKEKHLFFCKFLNCFTLKMTVLRYCSKLSDKTVLVPRWTEEEICRDAVNPDWLDKINAAMELYPPSKKLYRVHLLLPLSSPLREEIVGPALPSKLYAKRAVALEACKKLHQLGELDNVHLLPITQVDQLEDEPIDEEANCTDSSLGTSKRKQIYRKEIAKAFSDCLPQAGQDCYIYQLNFKLINSARDETTTCYLSDAGNKFAILTSNCLPTICPIPLVTRAGEMTVEVVGVDSVVLNFEQLEKLKRFHQHLVEDVMLLFKTREDFDFENPTLGLLIVPVKQEDSSVDFELVNRILASPPINWDARERKFYWDPARYVDAVITPWYTDPEERTIYYVDAVTGMTPLDTFPNEKFSNYASYVS